MLLFYLGCAFLRLLSERVYWCLLLCVYMVFVGSYPCTLCCILLGFMCSVEILEALCLNRFSSLVKCVGCFSFEAPQ